ncbi:MAG: hypothetical protein OXU36_23955 [Candidatus Poribacteria bacterium]|nr:hypothetical protein [Candidatus Poribacteria bacterium]
MQFTNPVESRLQKNLREASVKIPVKIQFGFQTISTQKGVFAEIQHIAKGVLYTETQNPRQSA